MPNDPPPQPVPLPSGATSTDLLRSLGRLVRGLSALFWGLPFALVISVQTARTEMFANLGLLPPLITQSCLLFGVLELRHFHPQERVWQRAVERLLVLALINLGLSPFLFWWNKIPHQLHFQLAVAGLAVSGLLFLFCLNGALQRLAAMLPDQTLRIEAHLFTTVNRTLVGLNLVLIAVWITLVPFQVAPHSWYPFIILATSIGLVVVVLLVLLPLSLTMVMLWRTKETLLNSIFSHAS